MNVAHITRNIGIIAKASKKLDSLIQATAEGVMLHAHQHREVSLVNKLYLALGAGHRHTAMTEWLVKYCPVTANTREEDKKEVPFLIDVDKVMAGDELIELAAAAGKEPWFTMSPSRAPDEVFDVKKALMALIAKSKKAKTITAPEVMSQLQGMADSLPAQPKKEAKA